VFKNNEKKFRRIRMKKIVLYVTVLMLFMVMSTSLAAGDKKINLLGNLGLATSDFEGLFFDVGAEFQFTNNLFAQLLFDYYFNPAGEDIPGIDDSAYGFNLYGVYKFSSSSKLNLFAKAGVHYTTVKLSADLGGMTGSIEESDFGIGGGLGVELSLGEKVALVFGSTVKLLFSDEENLTWYKFYGGINFTIN
jgi:hypothetical protein